MRPFVVTPEKVFWLSINRLAFSAGQDTHSSGTGDTSVPQPLQPPTDLAQNAPTTPHHGSTIADVGSGSAQKLSKREMKALLKQQAKRSRAPIPLDDSLVATMNELADSFQGMLVSIHI